MKNKSEREIATYILVDISTQKSYNNIILRKTLNQNNALLPMQRAFITELVNGTLRNLIYIDYVISLFSKMKINKMKPFILNLLRISVYQILFLDKVPDSAVCNEAVNLAKAKGFKDLSGFINGVLRNVVRSESIELPNEEKEPIKYLSIKYSYDEWIIKYWLESYSYETVYKMCQENNKRPNVTICVNRIKTDRETLKNKLLEEGIETSYGNIIDDALRISPKSNIAELNSFKDGLFHIMDESSMLAVNILNPPKNGTIFDMCGSPGGKTFYMSYLTNDTGEIVCTDIYEHKINLINQGKERLGLKNIVAQVNDATKKDDSKLEKADCVLVDAPCSGLGLVRKKPDIKYTKSLDEIYSLMSLQREILTVGAKYVKSGGTLVYSTCTISKLENEDNISWFINNFPFELEDINCYLPEKLKCKEKGYVQILPTDYNTDGFFIAKLRRKDNE